MTPIRRAGLLYLLLGITGAIGLFGPRAVIVQGDAAATADKIRSSESLFRVMISSELISSVVFIFVALALYRVFRDVDQGQAALMVILVLVSVPISFLNVLNELGALVLLSGADFLSVFDRSQLDAVAYLFLRLHSLGIVVVEMFWGLWLLPLAGLTFRSGVVPRVVGALLIVAGVGYVVTSLTSLLVPQYASLVSTITLPATVGEFAIIVWLLFTRRGTVPARAQVA